MDRPNYRRGRKGETIIISQLKKTACTHEQCIPQKREACSCLATCPSGKTSAVEVTLSEQQTTTACNGREDSFCEISDKTSLFSVLALAESKLCVFGQLTYFPWLLFICTNQGWTQILCTVFFLILKSLIFVNTQVISAIFKSFTMFHYDYSCLIE